MKNVQLTAALLVVFLAAGCKSRVIRVSIVNNSQDQIKNVIIDYPGATFGVAALAPQKSFQYSIKPQDTGALKIQFANARGINHVYPGPIVHKEDEGSIEIKLTQDAALSDSKLVPGK
jgi:hypothetical protein